MSVNKMAGACLILLAIVNALHDVAMRSNGRGTPGVGYAIVTALFFTFGVVFCLRRDTAKTKPQKARGPSILED
jgi:hypothetical protein